MAQYNSTIRLHQLNIPELSGYISQFIGTPSGNTGISGIFGVTGSGRIVVAANGNLFSVGFNDYNLTNSGDLTNLYNSCVVYSQNFAYPLTSGNNLAAQISLINNWTGKVPTGSSGVSWFLSGTSGISILSGLNNYVISYTGNNSFVPLSQFNQYTSTGFNYLYLKDNNKILSSVFNQGQDFYLQGQESFNISNPYVIDLYGSLAPNYSLQSGQPYILGFDVYAGKLTSSGSQVLTFSDTEYYISPAQLSSLSGSLMNSILRYRSIPIAVSGMFILSGAGNIDVSNNGNLVIISGEPPSYINTGAFYPISGNPSGFIMATQTGNFVTTNQTGNLAANTGQLVNVFYPLNNNPAGYITSSQTGVFGQAGNTGVLTGTFYPLKSNPSGYITGINTSSFITTGQSGMFYPTSNPSGFVTGINTGYYTGIFYPLNSNPSGYILPSQTGNFAANTGQLVNVFYPLNSNPSGYLARIIPSQFITSSIDWSTSNSFYTKTTGNTTINFFNVQDGQSITLSTYNPSGYTISWSGQDGSGIRWPQQNTPIQTIFTDIYTFICITGSIFGNVIQGF
jgi:hypothetical protein